MAVLRFPSAAGEMATPKLLPDVTRLALARHSYSPSLPLLLGVLLKVRGRPTPEPAARQMGVRRTRMASPTSRQEARPVSHEVRRGVLRDVVEGAYRRPVPTSMGRQLTST